MAWILLNVPMSRLRDEHFFMQQDHMQERVASLPTKRTRNGKNAVLVLVLAAVLGCIIHWPVLSKPHRMHDSWRQVPHWTVAEKQQFHPDDLLIRYARFNTAPFADFLYETLALTGLDTQWGKINTILFFAVTAMLVYLTGCVICNRLAGWVATLLYLFFPCALKIFEGGYMSGLSMPLLCLTVLLMYRARWWWTVPLLMTASVIYPMAAVQSGMMLFLDFLRWDLFADYRKIWTRKFVLTKALPLALAAGACLLILSGKYLDDTHEFGHLVTRAEIGERIEFTRAGRAVVTPVRPLSNQLERHWGNPFHVGFFLLAFLVLGKRFLQLPRGLWALLCSGIVLYWLADIMLMKLYIPNRYLLRTLPLFVALAGGCWISQMLTRSRPFAITQLRLQLMSKLSPTACALGLLIPIGVFEFSYTFIPPGHMSTASLKKNKLYSFLRSLPGRPMIAAHPMLGSEIPLMSGKSVLISKELAHPWWTAYWEVTVERTQDFFRAYYSNDPVQIRAFLLKHQIDYWLIQPKDFSPDFLRARQLYFEPFNTWIVRELRPVPNGLLAQVPVEYRLYNDKRYFVVARPALEEWLTQVERRSRPFIQQAAL